MGKKGNRRSDARASNRRPSAKSTPTTQGAQTQNTRREELRAARLAERKREQEELRQKRRKEAAKQQRQARRRRATRALLHSRLTLLALTLVLLGITAVGTFAVIDEEETTKVTGRLRGIQEVRFTAATQSDGGISPLCGCMLPPLDSWRGITFAARQVTLAQPGHDRWTTWVLSSAEPDRVALEGGIKRLDMLAVRFRPKDHFDPRWMLDPKSLRRHGDIIAAVPTHAYRASLIEQTGLHVALLGNVPIGSWIPFPGSQVVLGSVRSPFSENGGAHIVEHYPTGIGFEAKGSAAKDQAYPLGDFLGPNVVLWTEDPEARMPGTAFAHPSTDGVVTAFAIRESAFSTRIAAVPLSQDEFVARRKLDTEEPRRARGNVFFGRSDGGTVEVSIDEPLTTKNYERVRQSLAAHPTAEVDATMMLSADENANATEEVWTEQERYPPMPRELGFNIFGPMSSVTFRGVRGHVSIADEAHDLSASADIDLSDVRGLRNAGDAQLVSAPLSTTDHAADLQFRAVGRVRINGVSQTTFIHRHKDGIAVLGLALTLAGFILGTATFARGFSRNKPSG